MRADRRIKRVDMCAEPEAGQRRQQGGHKERTRMDREAGQRRGQGPGMTVCLEEKQLDPVTKAHNFMNTCLNLFKPTNNLAFNRNVCFHHLFHHKFVSFL